MLNEITNKKFNNNNFLEFGKEKIQMIKLNSVRDNKKFDINAVEVLYSLPEKSFTLINDENNNIYLAKVKKFEKQIIDINKEEFKQYITKQNEIFNVNFYFCNIKHDSDEYKMISFSLMNKTKFLMVLKIMM